MRMAWLWGEGGFTIFYVNVDLLYLRKVSIFYQANCKFEFD